MLSFGSGTTIRSSNLFLNIFSEGYLCQYNLFLSASTKNICIGLTLRFQQKKWTANISATERINEFDERKFVN